MVSDTNFTLINRNIEKLLVILFYITIFLLPTHFFLILRPGAAYVQGHFIEYLAPKFMASQGVIWLLWVVSGWKGLVATRGKSPQIVISPFLRRRLTFLLSGVALASLIVGLNIQRWNDLPLLWWLLSVLSGPILWGVWLMIFPRLWRPHLWNALLLATLFQAGMGWLQWWRQESLVGYWFLGEPDLGSAGIIASSLGEQVRRLPYGTTAHPNVLAGWLLLGVVAGWKMRKKFWYQSIFFLVEAVLLGCLFLTESWSAWLSLGGLLLLPWLYRRKLPSDKWRKFAFISTFVAVMAFSPLAWQSGLAILQERSPTPSTTRRWQLNNWANEDLRREPGGIGLTQAFQGNFHREQNYVGARFLQPVHNSLLFLTLVGGYWVYLVFSYFLYREYRLYTFIFCFFLAFLPLFSLDHYAVSLPEGQYLSILLLVILSKNETHFHPQ